MKKLILFSVVGLASAGSLIGAQDHLFVLHSIERNSFGDVGRRLLKAGKNSADASGKTPLMQAALMGNYDAVSKLINAGADVNAKDEDGTRALLYARRSYPGKTQAQLDEIEKALGGKGSTLKKHIEKDVEKVRDTAHTSPKPSDRRIGQLMKSAGISASAAKKWLVKNPVIAALGTAAIGTVGIGGIYLLQKAGKLPNAAQMKMLPKDALMGLYDFLPTMASMKDQIPSMNSLKPTELASYFRSKQLAVKPS